MEPNIILDATSDIASHGGYLGAINGFLLFLIMAIIGVLALYLSARWVVGEKSMLPAIFVVVIAFVIMYALSLIGLVGWILIILFIVFYVVVIKLVYCRRKEHGWGEAIMIWVITILCAFLLGLFATFMLTALGNTFQTASATNPILTYILAIVTFAVCIYILYWVVVWITTKPQTSSRD